MTDAGKRIIEQCLDVKLELTEPWNRGAVGSIMLAPVLLMPLGIFALLETGCSEVWRNGETLISLAPEDADETRQNHLQNAHRRYAYAGPRQAAIPGSSLSDW